MGKEVILVGGLYPHETYMKILENSRSGFQGAADSLQWKLVKGLNDCVGASHVHVLNSLYIGSYPNRYGQMYIDRYEFETYTNIINGINAPFINVPIIKELFRAQSLKRELNRLLSQTEDPEQVILIGYAASFPIVKTLLYAGTKWPGIKTCLVVPDLPEYMELGQGPISALRRFKNRLVESDMLAVDKFVLLTDAMASYFALDPDRYCVVEGIADGDSNPCSDDLRINQPREFRRNLLYTGTLQYKYGIRELIDSVLELDRDDVCLTICGDGEASEEISQLSVKYPFIRYLGVVPINEVKRLQSEADFLINPRNCSDEYTKYSFPSKMMEYLSSGVPVIAYMLPGMPSEYAPYFIHANDRGLKAAIDAALSLTDEELNALASSARLFVLEEKNPAKQVAKILNLMEFN